MAETFTDRLNRLVVKANLSEADLASTIGVSSNQAGRLLDGTTKSMKLEQALKLCRKLRISPWELGGEKEPAQLRSVARMESPSPEDLVAQGQQALEAAGIHRTIGALLEIVRDVPGLPPQTIERLQILTQQHEQNAGEQAS
jgi:DNA-binding Xre family transcriptional regulator